MYRNLILYNLCEWTRNLFIKLVIIKKLYYDARPTKYQDVASYWLNYLDHVNHGCLYWTLCISTQVSEQIFVHQNSEKLLSHAADEGYISSNVVIRQVSGMWGWFQRHKASSQPINTWNVQQQIRGLKMPSKKNDPSCLFRAYNDNEGINDSNLNPDLFTFIRRVNYNWNIKKWSIKHNSLIPYKCVLQIAVYQNHPHPQPQQPSGRRPLTCWDHGFESHRGHGYLSVVSVVCCQVEVSATTWSLVQRSPTDCAASSCVI